jgi:hypothetical protein
VLERANGVSSGKRATIEGRSRPIGHRPKAAPPTNCFVVRTGLLRVSPVLERADVASLSDRVVSTQRSNSAAPCM